jgi:hypothetical protein
MDPLPGILSAVVYLEQKVEKLPVLRHVARSLRPAANMPPLKVDAL